MPVADAVASWTLEKIFCEKPIHPSPCLGRTDWFPVRGATLQGPGFISTNPLHKGFHKGRMPVALVASWTLEKIFREKPIHPSRTLNPKALPEESVRGFACTLGWRMSVALVASCTLEKIFREKSPISYESLPTEAGSYLRLIDFFPKRARIQGS